MLCKSTGTKTEAAKQINVVGFSVKSKVVNKFCTYHKTHLLENLFVKHFAPNHQVTNKVPYVNNKDSKNGKVTERKS